MQRKILLINQQNETRTYLMKMKIKIKIKKYKAGDSTLQGGDPHPQSQIRQKELRTIDSQTKKAASQ